MEAPHADGYSAIVGGYVYRGAAIPSLDGVYLYGDDCRPDIEGLVQRGGRAVQQRDLGMQVQQLTTFGEDGRGELYVAAHGGTILPDRRRLELVTHTLRIAPPMRQRDRVWRDARQDAEHLVDPARDRDRLVLAQARRDRRDRDFVGFLPHELGQPVGGNVGRRLEARAT